MQPGLLIDGSAGNLLRQPPLPPAVPGAGPDCGGRRTKSWGKWCFPSEEIVLLYRHPTDTLRMNQKIVLQYRVLTALIVVAAFSRMVPHPPNFSPLGAVSLFASAHFAHRYQAFMVPLVAVWLSDLFINNVIYGVHYPEFTWFYTGFYWQYGTYALIVALGRVLYHPVSVHRVVFGAVGSSVLFFLITNFGCWLGSAVYPQTWSGLMLCYGAGLPFFQGTLMGDLFFNLLLFGAYYGLQRRFPALRNAPSPA